MSTDLYDVVIIGGGMAGVHAAYPLVKKGLNVALVDGGIVSDLPFATWHTDTFEHIRKTRADQYTLFLGTDLSAVPITSKTHAASMTSGSRAYVTKRTDELLPLASGDATILQSLAKGGLGEAWGAVCEFFDDEELQEVGLPVTEIKKSYQEIIKRIGVSGTRIDYKMQPQVTPDLHAKKILQMYRKKKKIFIKEGIQVSQSVLALLTKKVKKRLPTSYNDMDFWSNKGKAIYRPSLTIDELRNNNHFTYVPGVVISHVKEKIDYVIIFGNRLQTNEEVSLKGKKVILAAGSVNSTRILLKSFGFFHKKVPFLYKQNILIPALHIARIHPQDTRHQISFCQVIMYNKNKIHGLSKCYVQMYSYKSLLLHKLLSYIPFPAKEAMTLLSILTPHLMLIDARFPNDMKNKAYIELEKKRSGERLIISPVLSEEMKKNLYKEITTIKKYLLQLHLIPLKTVFPEKGATAHYAGGIPFKNEETSQYPLTVDINGKLNQAKRIYVADASSWLALPAKPHSLTIMAQANLVGKNLLRDFS